MHRRFSISGIRHVLEDGFGRLYFDMCPTDADHMAAPTPEIFPKRQCRAYVNDLFKDLIGKRGRLQVTIEFEPNTEDPSHPGYGSVHYTDINEEEEE